MLGPGAAKTRQQRLRSKHLAGMGSLEPQGKKRFLGIFTESEQEWFSAQ